MTNHVSCFLYCLQTVTHEPYRDMWNVLRVAYIWEKVLHWYVSSAIPLWLVEVDVWCLDAVQTRTEASSNLLKCGQPVVDCGEIYRSRRTIADWACNCCTNVLKTVWDSFEIVLGKNHSIQKMQRAKFRKIACFLDLYCLQVRIIIKMFVRVPKRAAFCGCHPRKLKGQKLHRFICCSNMCWRKLQMRTWVSVSFEQSWVCGNTACRINFIRVFLEAAFQ